MEFWDSIELLAKQSDLARRICKRGYCTSTTIFEEDDYMFNNQFGFHPNGKCGCIKTNDKYIFDIRCEHLMWAEGYVEYNLCNDEENLVWNESLNNNGQLVTKENMYYEGAPFDDRVYEGNAILIYGNHKGIFIMKLITIPKKPKIN